MRLLIGALALAFTGTAQAQTWPDKPVHIVVAFTPGSATDVIGRSVSNELSARLGQPFIIENRPGAGGTIATAQVAKAAPDGYTLLLNSSGHTVNPWIYSNLSYDTAKDLKGITLLARQPNLNVPTSIVFDLDPGEPAGLLECAEVALHLRKNKKKWKD